MEMYIVLAVTIFMMVMFVWHKVPFGVTTMTCCVILMVTGCIDLNVQIASPNGHLCHIRRTAQDIISGQVGTH